MKIKHLSFYLTVILGLSTVYSAYADTPMLEKIGQNYFKDPEGRVIYYPCSMGGEPLVIYAHFIGADPISSKSELKPIYIEKGYQASPLVIPSYEQIDKTDNQNLIIQTINPAFGYVSIDLTRKDGKQFYVDTANFPIVDSQYLLDGTLERYVSIFNVTINNSESEYAHTDTPIYNYSFDESAGLYVYRYVTEIKANIASWNQRSHWTDGRLGRHYSNIPYRFSPIKIKNGPIDSYDGFGFWICGSDVQQDDNKMKDQKSYKDTVQ